MFHDSHNTLPRPQSARAEYEVLDSQVSGFVEGYEDEKGDFEPEPRLERVTPPPHPGAILRDLYLPKTGVNLTQLADRLHVSRRTISMIINGSRPITVDMAHRLSRAFGTTPELWLRLQNTLDTWEAAHLNRAEYERIERLEPIAA